VTKEEALDEAISALQRANRELSHSDGSDTAWVLCIYADTFVNLSQHLPSAAQSVAP
jgi:hypothetical protein